MKKYIVTLRFQFPAYDERNGYQFEVEANCKSNAIKKAKKESEDIWQHAKQGRVTFKAEEAEC